MRNKARHRSVRSSAYIIKVRQMQTKAIQSHLQERKESDQVLSAAPQGRPRPQRIAERSPKCLSPCRRRFSSSSSSPWLLLHLLRFRSHLHLWLASPRDRRKAPCLQSRVEVHEVQGFYPHQPGSGWGYGELAQLYRHLPQVLQPSAPGEGPGARPGESRRLLGKPGRALEPLEPTASVPTHLEKLRP